MDDTSPEARRVQVELLRSAGPVRRAQIASDLTNQALWRARRGIAMAHPRLSEIERRLLFVAVHYGPELAHRVRAHLARGGPRMTSGDDLAALVPVADALDALGVEFYVGGSAASSAHGFARATIDIDLVAALGHGHVERLVSTLSGGYYLDPAAIHQAIDGSRACNLIHLATMYKIDVFVMKGRPYDRQVRARATRQPLAAGGRDFPVASPEDVILSKLEWYRAGNEVSQRQWQDVIGVMQVQRDSIDRGYLSQWGAALSVTGLLARAWDEAGG